VEKIVCDTGPILHLWEAGLLDLLAKTGKIFIPKMVNAELIEINPSWEEQRPSWIYIEPLSPSETSQAELLYKSGLVDIGEAEAIILARRFKADWFLTDDIAARVLANSINLECHGSLGVVLWTSAVGNLNYREAKTVLDKLFHHSSLWASKNIIEEAYKALEKIF